MWCFWPLFFLIFFFDDGGRRRCRRRRRERFDDPGDVRSLAESQDFPRMKRFCGQDGNCEKHDCHCDK